MCYYVHQHSLIHDARPNIKWSSRTAASDVTIINPYAAPTPCRSCQSQDTTIARWLRCSFGHGCCYLTSWVVRCTRDPVDCGERLVPYHAYVQQQPSRSSVEQLLHEAPDSPDSFFDDDDDDDDEQEGWYPWPVLDEQIGRPENRESLFPPHDTVVFKLGQEILECAARLEGVVEEANALWMARDTNGCARALAGACEGQQEDDGLEAVLQEEREDYVARTLAASEITTKMKDLDKDLAELESQIAVKCMLFEAIAHGFTGDMCDNGGQVWVGKGSRSSLLRSV